MLLTKGYPKIDFEKEEDNYYIILDNEDHLFLYVVFESCLTMDDGIDQIWPHEFEERIKAYYKIGKIEK
jgi:hypothetical protein